MKTKAWIIVLIGISWGCASQEDVLILDQRNNILEAQLAQLKAQVVEHEKDNQNIRNQTALFFAELEALKDQYQALNGKIEELAYLSGRAPGGIESQVQEDTKQLKNMETEAAFISDRIAQLEKYLGLEIPVRLTDSESSSSLDNTPLSDKALYQHAKEAFDRNDFEIAQQEFQQFLKQFPKSDDADNAQFWIGEIYFQEKWYEKAIVEYQKVIENYPKGNKVPAALLKQGLAFSHLNDKTNSRLALKDLISKFPKSPEADIARNKLKDL